ncbi:Outer membrane protein beta-barrel domain-containing protein [Chryseobacterium rhizoplanae]|uniref:Outer membrane protein beta-barrel domain-containing protein n=1 Tax=Chryseobacterium rhizoplanae TaxID=1609531 RepID=A0A521DM31_9FLAO|nr:porin family protein [Chryseobacterium rhizoplanae]SMO72757.1 Outer membrane protein beta-barrel domain-containing protein [Chryseobacterium rhizoplanae]
MKKQSVIIFLMLSVAMTAQKVNFAVEAGFGLSNVHTNETSGISNASGFNAGISTRIQLNKKLWFQSGLFYSPKGAQKTISTENSTINTRRVINYFELPANIVYYFDGEKAGGLFVSTGMYVALAAGGHTLKTVTGTDKKIEKYRKDIAFGQNVNQVQRFDYGLSVGLGYQSPLGIYIKGEYQIGLHNVVNTKYLYNRSVQLMIGYVIKHRVTL